MRCVIPILLVIATASCASHPGKVNAPVAAEPRNAAKVIARIASRHTTIVVRAGATEPTYSLETAAGEVLVKDMTLGELAQTNPEMRDRVRNMQAQVLWAGE
jgi:hypothetical protein